VPGVVDASPVWVVPGSVELGFGVTLQLADAGSTLQLADAGSALQLAESARAADGVARATPNITVAEADSTQKRVRRTRWRSGVGIIAVMAVRPFTRDIGEL
jgi:hypothetical protein